MLTQHETEHWLSHWSRYYHQSNFNGWKRENFLYQFLRMNVIIPLRTDDLPDIDPMKAKAVDACIADLALFDEPAAYVLIRLYGCNWSIRRTAMNPLDGREWTKSTVGRVKERGLVWLGRNLEAFSALT